MFRVASSTLRSTGRPNREIRHFIFRNGQRQHIRIGLSQHTFEGTQPIGRYSSLCGSPRLPLIRRQYSQLNAQKRNFSSARTINSFGSNPRRFSPFATLLTVFGVGGLAWAL